MKWSIFDNFSAKNGEPVFTALKKGLDAAGIKHVSHDMMADVAVIWSVLWAGRMHHNQQVWNHFRQSGRPVVVVEVGMLQRGQTWKLGVNGTGSYAYYGDGLDLQRAEKIALPLKPWRQTGSRIIVCAQRTQGLQWATQPPMEQWLANLRDQVRLYTQRPLVLRTHPRQKIGPITGYEIERPQHLPGTYDDFDFVKTLNDAWAVINHNSGPGSQAVIAGIPAFVDASSLAAPVANLSIADIENPRMPDRGDWFLRLCHTEWTIPEIESGWPIQRLLPGIYSQQ